MRTDPQYKWVEVFSLSGSRGYGPGSAYTLDLVQRTFVGDIIEAMHRKRGEWPRHFYSALPGLDKKTKGVLKELVALHRERLDEMEKMLKLVPVDTVFGSEETKEKDHDPREDQ